MMMAHDSTPPPPSTLSEETHQALRDSLEKFASNGVDVSSLRDVLRRVAVEARESGIPPERLLVILKDYWHNIPAIRNAKDGREKAGLLQQIVAICIEAYYA